MITKTQALQLKHGDTLYHATLRNADGTPIRVRVNGHCQTWKTQPDRFRLPTKHGLYSYLCVDEANADEWNTQLEERKER